MSDSINNSVDTSKEKFQILPMASGDSEKILRPSMTYWQDAWRRFKKNKLALVALIMLCLVVFFTIFGPAISGNQFDELNRKNKNETSSSEFWFGTDNLGRDLFTRVCVGGRVSLIIGLVCTLVMVTIGMLIGGIAGYIGGITDDLLMRLVEIIGSIPRLVLVILISLILDKGMLALVLAMTITAWGGTARLVRGQILQLREQEFVLAAKSLGAGPARIILEHLLPNVLSLIIVRMTFAVPGFIFDEAFLSYIGLGIQPPNTSWGALASAAQDKIMFYPHQLFFPALFIVATMLSFNMIGDGLSDALDPKLRK